MANYKEISFYLIDEFNNWLYDIGKKRGQYDSYINTLANKSLSSISDIEQAKNVVKKLLGKVDIEISKLKGKEKKTLVSKRSGLRSYLRFLSYNPINYINYDYNGIRELAELIESSRFSLIKYMVSHTLFPDPKLVMERAKEIAEKIESDEKVPARFSKGKKYRDSSGTLFKFSSREVAFKETRNKDYFFIENDIKVETDSNGNNTICVYLANHTSINITSGDISRNCYGYMISHIWAKANDPLFFSNFWNIVLMPQHVSFILDKGREMACVQYAKVLYQAIAYVLYKESIDIIKDALNAKGKRPLKIEIPEDDILSDARRMIKRIKLKYIQKKR